MRTAVLIARGAQALFVAPLLAVAIWGLATPPRAEAFAYWTSTEPHNTGVGRADLDGTGADQRFITGAEEPVGVAVTDSHIY